DVTSGGRSNGPHPAYIPCCPRTADCARSFLWLPRGSTTALLVLAPASAGAWLVALRSLKLSCWSMLLGNFHILGMFLGNFYILIVKTLSNLLGKLIQLVR